MKHVDMCDDISEEPLLKNPDNSHPLTRNKISRHKSGCRFTHSCGWLDGWFIDPQLAACLWLVLLDLVV